MYLFYLTRVPFLDILEKFPQRPQPQLGHVKQTQPFQIYQNHQSIWWILVQRQLRNHKDQLYGVLQVELIIRGVLQPPQRNGVVFVRSSRQNRDLTEEVNLKRCANRKADLPDFHGSLYVFGVRVSVEEEFRRSRFAREMRVNSFLGRLQLVETGQQEQNELFVAERRELLG
jgi:phage protein U